LTDISVIICSYNPRPDDLGRVLEALKVQTLPRDRWELLLVDNASRRRLADQWDLSWHIHHAHIRENELGLTPARLRGIAETSGSLLVFLDDDNVPAPDYLERAAAIAQIHPHLGVLGAGVLEPEFEREPSREISPLLKHLAIRSTSSGCWTNNTRDNHGVPWGAGLCVIRPIAAAYQQIVARLNISQVLDRCGDRLFCGGDDLFSWVAARAGYGFGVFPELRITHLISAARLNRAYLLRLVHDHAYSHGILKYLWFNDEQDPLGVEGAIRMLLHGARRGWFSMLCRWAEVRGASGARRYIAAHGLRPIGSQSSDLASPLSAPQPQMRTRVL
jgi:glycosyltransferase involved in cell wall biosynthesis